MKLNPFWKECVDYCYTLNASAIHPAMSESPPSGVMAPKRGVSVSTSAYKEPLKSVIPTVRSRADQLLGDCTMSGVIVMSTECNKW